MNSAEVERGDVVDKVVLVPMWDALGTTADKLGLTPGQVRIWGMHSMLSLADQGLTSGAGFGVNLVLARWLPTDIYGAFAVTFAGFLFVSGFHNVLLLEPMSVIGPSRHSKDLPSYLRSQILVHLGLVGVMAVLAVLTGTVLWRINPTQSLPKAIIGVGFALPLLLLLWLARRMCYALRKPAVALGGSALYFAVSLAGLVLLWKSELLNPFSVFMLMGAGSGLAASVVLRQLKIWGVELHSKPAGSWYSTLRENWTYGRWLVGSTVLFSLYSQAQTFLVADFLGLGAAGILRAMQIPSLIMTQVTTAIGLLVLPEFSYDFGKGLTTHLKHKAMLISVGLMAGALCFAVLLVLFAHPTEQVLFGGRYAEYAWMMPLLALVPVCAGFSMGYSMALRAFQKPHFDLITNAFSAPVGILSAIFFIRWWGLGGAAASLVLSFMAASLSNVIGYRWYLRSDLTGRMARKA